MESLPFPGSLLRAIKRQAATFSEYAAIKALVMLAGETAYDDATVPVAMIKELGDLRKRVETSDLPPKASEDIVSYIANSISRLNTQPSGEEKGIDEPGGDGGSPVPANRAANAGDDYAHGTKMYLNGMPD